MRVGSPGEIVLVISFIIGLLLGATTVGAYTARTLSILAGNPARTVAASALVSATYWFGINFIVEDNLSGYIGFSLGAAVVTGFFAYKEKTRKENG